MGSGPLKPTRFLSRRQPGFTIIELIVTMVLIGILAVVVLPRFDLLKGFDEIGYRDKVRATLEYARKSAVAQRRYVCVNRNGNGLILTRDLRDPDTLSFATVACPDSGNNRLGLPTPDTKYCPAGANANQICAPDSSGFAAAPTLLKFSPLGQPDATATYTISGAGPDIVVEAETGYVR